MKISEILDSIPWIKLPQLAGQRLGDSIRDSVGETFVQTESHLVINQVVDSTELCPRQRSQNPDVHDHSQLL